jgi:50S ribosomal protein L16 3-hydroxylase
MVSFAAPGGGVGPHRDQYDVFLCQGFGVRDWRYSGDAIPVDSEASDDLLLLSEFDSGCRKEATQGDILYLPPGVAHWGTAKRACMTYSIGMRAPALNDLARILGLPGNQAATLYTDPDLAVSESQPGYISPQAVRRAAALLGQSETRHDEIAIALGCLVTQPKDWLHPEAPTADELDVFLRGDWGCRYLDLHGMALLAFDDSNLFVNGATHTFPTGAAEVVSELCETRRLKMSSVRRHRLSETVAWMLSHGAFAIPEFS